MFILENMGKLVEVSLFKLPYDVFSFSDNYGFVTFLNKLDAYKAVEHGNDDPFYPKYDLSFGGRREFCKTTYSDLGNN